MTADQLWPDEAREAIARAVAESHEEPDTSRSALVHLFYFETADAVLAALSAHAVPRAKHDEMMLNRHRRLTAQTKSTEEYLMDGHESSRG